MQDYINNSGSFNFPSIELVAARLIASPPQNNLSYRPYRANLTSYAVEQMNILTKDGTNINPFTLNKVASQIIAPSTTPQGEVYIQNGFDNHRYTFWLQFEVRSPLVKNVTYEYFTGYTDTLNVNPATGSIDPNLRFYLNNRMQVGISNNIGPYGQNSSVAIKECCSLLHKPEYIHQNGKTILMQDTTYGMRPQDAMIDLQVSAFINEADVFYDTRNMMDKVPLQADQSFLLPANYISSFIDAYRSVGNPLNFNGNEASSVHDKAIGLVGESNIVLCQFYNKLLSSKNSDGISFTFGEINSLWPRPNDFWQIIHKNPNSRIGSPLDNPKEYCNSWGGISEETNIAFSLAHVMSSIMSANKIMSTSVSITNYTQGNIPNVAILDATSLFSAGVSMQEVNSLKGDIMLHIVQGLLNGINLYSINLKMNLTLNSLIEISINGGNFESLCAPSFCDSLYNPMLGLDYSYVNTLSNTMGTLVDNFSYRADRSSGILLPDVQSVYPQTQTFNNFNGISDIPNMGD